MSSESALRTELLLDDADDTDDTLLTLRDLWQETGPTMSWRFLESQWKITAVTAVRKQYSHAQLHNMPTSLHKHTFVFLQM